MHHTQFPSKLLEAAVSEFSQLPGIGRKTALRLVLHLLRQDKVKVDSFSSAISELKAEVKFCSKCHNISDDETCNICSSIKRDDQLICVVENIRDVMSIEQTSQFNGLYHVLGGVISPMEGIGPADLEIDSLFKRAKENEIREIVIALPTTMEGDTTSFYIFKHLSGKEVLITTLSRGVSIGDTLEYNDDLTLGRSILHRLPFSDTLNS